MRRKLQPLVCAALMICAVAATGCRSQQQSSQQNNQQPVAAQAARGECPKLEGSYFGSDKSTIKKGERVSLSYKIPREYASTMMIAGLPAGAPPSIKSFTVEPSNGPLDIPEFAEGSYSAQPDKTQLYTLKATGPRGCQPLVLPALVNVTNQE